MCFNPSLREINLQLGGKIEETRTMLHAAIPAFRSANSKLESRSRCFPTPLVRNIFLATNAMVPGRGLRKWFHAENICACGKVTRRFRSVNEKNELEREMTPVCERTGIIDSDAAKIAFAVLRCAIPISHNLLLNSPFPRYQPR